MRGTERLLTAAQGEVGLWVQLSSTGVYGPVRSGVVDEERILAPVNSYERTKAAGDLLVQAAAKSGLKCFILRPSNIYGPDMPNQSLFQLIRMIDLGLFCHIDSRGPWLTTFMLVMSLMRWCCAQTAFCLRPDVHTSFPTHARWSTLSD